MADGYKYTIAQCDVPEERRRALRQFRDKRQLWSLWLDQDAHAIWQTVHAMVWTDVAFKVLSGLAEDDDNALNNPLIVETLLSGHVATQVLAVRRLMDRGSSGIISLRRLVTDVGSNFHLFTRENFVCFDGLPYDYQAVQQARLEKLTPNKGQPIFMWLATDGPEADGASEMAHEEFDRLAGIDPAKRTPLDRLPRRLLATIEKWLVDSDADDLAKWSHVYLAHGGDRAAREAKAELKVTANRIAGAIKVLARATEAAARLLRAGGRSSALMPTAQFNQFEKLDKPVMRSADSQDAANSRWRQLSDEWDRCLDGVEDDLVRRPPDC